MIVEQPDFCISILVLHINLPSILFGFWFKKNNGLFCSPLSVRKRRFELPQPFDRYHLKVVRLPISPPPRQAANVIEKLIC